MAFKAVPVNGVLEPYPFFATGRLTKFQRPVFGNQRLYASRQQTLIALAPPGTVPAQPPATCSVKGKIITYNWNVTWVSASPDGFTRPVVGINGQWPCPPIAGKVGDTIKINLVNMLGNQTTTLHFHGLFQRNTTFEDGPAMVNQCPIPPGLSFVYQFDLLQPGTYWWHAHVGGQYMDGLRGPLIITDPSAPWSVANTPYKVDQEYTLTLSDWYHDQAPYLINYYLSPTNTDTTGGAEPVPNSALINDAQNVRFAMTPGKTYLFRIINMGALAGQYLQFDQHDMQIVEVDGVYTLPRTVSQLFVAVAQRYSVIVKAKASAAQNFAIVSQFNTDMFGSSITPPDMNPTCTAYLVYDASKSLPAPFTLTPQVWDDSTLVPWDQEPLLDGPDVRRITFTADFGVDAAGSTRGFMSSFTYVAQKVPTLFTALTAPAEYVMNPAIYGRVNPRVLTFNSIVEVTLNNHDTRSHPFHLHGHNFQVTNRGEGGALWPGLDTTPQYPMKRDVVIAYAGSSVTIRFIADNPGINLFHCHTEWHVESGLTATFIEAPDVLQAYKPYIPNSHKNACDALSISRKGNAGGNYKNWLDLSNSNTFPEDPANYWGAMIAPPPPR
ncbi:conidial pigment biosynthesis oxidase Abr1/brown 1 [Podospora didyma]|uniref:Conidial pigment biosynthesis oxidase Abr1/brown 1 n=1 Tax=Podospora didyma TaxID=330526 RepID=A0AAE0K6R3_9PEZI|nr:conidial pigment biosynthesis oxidase Abr1/brown 1 [Podospora didyma]